MCEECSAQRAQNPRVRDSKAIAPFEEGEPFPPPLPHHRNLPKKTPANAPQNSA